VPSAEVEDTSKNKFYIQDFEIKLKILFLLPAPYEIKKGIRFITGTNLLVPEKLNIISIDNFNKQLKFISITECSKILQIDRSKIKHCLITGEFYKNYIFKFNY
jgi:hypothetical protein